MKEVGSVIELAQAVEDAKAKLQKAEQLCADAIVSRDKAREKLKEARNALLESMGMGKKPPKPGAQPTNVITPAQKKLLKALDDCGTATVGEIAEETGMSSAGLSKCLKAMLKRGKIERLPDGQYALASESQEKLRA